MRMVLGAIIDPVNIDGDLMIMREVLCESRMREVRHHAAPWKAVSPTPFT